MLTVAAAAKKLAYARNALEDAMRSAHAKGASLRSIAKDAGLSHEQVRRIVSR